MKYWICSDAEGISLLCGEIAPVLEDGVFYADDDGFWIEQEYLDVLGIKYPKFLAEGSCLPLKLKIRSSW